MQTGGNEALDYPANVQYFSVAVVGAGAAAPTAPADGLVSPQFPKKANALSTLAAEIPTRSGAGAYVVTYDKKFTVFKMLSSDGPIMGAAGMWCQVTAINEATRQLTVKVFNAAGAATDLANGTDLMILNCRCVDSNTVKT